jgi:hypothetical protein
VFGLYWKRRMTMRGALHRVLGTPLRL